MATLSRFQIAELLNQAYSHRIALLPKFEAFRIVNGHADGFKGMTLDKFGSHYQIQFFSAECLSQESLIIKAVCEMFHPDYLAVKYRFSPSGKALEKPEIVTACGTNPVTICREGNCLFEVNLTDTVNPGLFLDMREIREDIEARAQGARVLNLFSYTCSFGVHARVGRAEHTVNVDISGKILEKGRKNYSLNHLECKPGEFFRGNSFEYLDWAKRKNKSFDIVILDPPSFARFNGFSFNVRHDLESLIQDSASVISSGGLLLVSSNYSGFEKKSFVRNAEFAIQKMEKQSKMIWTRSQSSDFRGSGSTKDSCLNAALFQIQ